MLYALGPLGGPLAGFPQRPCSAFCCAYLFRCSLHIPPCFSIVTTPVGGRGWGPVVWVAIGSVGSGLGVVGLVSMDAGRRLVDCAVRGAYHIRAYTPAVLNTISMSFFDQRLAPPRVPLPCLVLVCRLPVGRRPPQIELGVAETPTWPSRMPPRIAAPDRLVGLRRLGISRAAGRRYLVQGDQDVYLSLSRSKAVPRPLLHPHDSARSNKRHHLRRSTRAIAKMGSLLGKVKLFAFVQCAVFLVFVLEVADRLMY